MKISTKSTDQQLVKAFQKGNNQALEMLVARHKDKIFTSILLLVKDKYLAEDMFQDVFIKVIDTLRAGKYNEAGKFLPWALRIAHNLCIDHFRKVKRIRPVTTSEGEDIFEFLDLAGGDGADKKIQKRQSHSGVHELLELLPAEQREVVVLRHYADLSFKEIADMMNCSINTALGRMRYGLLGMRKLMAERQMAL